jgi:hypothetical protein
MHGRSQFVGTAGQYHVAFCLTVRGIHAAITLGNVPDVDIVAATSDGSRLLALQVKTSRWAHRPKRYGYELREWDVGQGAIGRTSPTLWYALVDLQEGNDDWKPLVFIVPSLWIGGFVKPEWGRKMYMLRSAPLAGMSRTVESYSRLPRSGCCGNELVHYCPRDGQGLGLASQGHLDGERRGR